MFLFEFFLIGQLISSSSSNNFNFYSNQDWNSNIKDCDDDGKGPEASCFCYNEPETDLDYHICPEKTINTWSILGNKNLCPVFRIKV